MYGRIFPKWLSLIFSYLAAFTLGGYAVGELRFGEHIDTARWVLTSFFGLMFFVDANLRNKN